MYTLTNQELEETCGGGDSFARDLGQFIGGYLVGFVLTGSAVAGVIEGAIAASN